MTVKQTADQGSLGTGVEQFFDRAKKQTGFGHE
jgi:hypothetical protein